MAVINRLLKDPNNTVLVLDNHSAHIGRDLTRLFDQSGITILNLPPHSSPLNPIENVRKLSKPFRTPDLET